MLAYKNKKNGLGRRQVECPTARPSPGLSQAQGYVTGQPRLRQAPPVAVVKTTKKMCEALKNTSVFLLSWIGSISKAKATKKHTPRTMCASRSGIQGRMSYDDPIRPVSAQRSRTGPRCVYELDKILFKLN